MTIRQINTYRVECDGLVFKEGRYWKCPVDVTIKATSEAEALENLPESWTVSPGFLQRTICGMPHAMDSGSADE
jgi:hypothetical protein